VGQRQGNLVNRYQLSGYVDVNLLNSYTKKFGAQKYTVQLNVDNLLDNTRYVSNGGNAVFFLPQRTVMGSIRIEF
jgi:iron complex outermembrane receptor protein